MYKAKSIRVFNQAGFNRILFPAGADTWMLLEPE